MSAGAAWTGALLYASPSRVEHANNLHSAAPLALVTGPSQRALITRHDNPQTLFEARLLRATQALSSS